MTLRNTLITAVVLAVPTSALAQPVSGLYVGAGAGFNYQPDSTIKSVSFGVLQAHGGHLKNEGGFVGVGSFGYGLGNGLRLEVEGDYRHGHSRVSGTRTSTGIPVSGGATVQTYGVMFNAFYDFDIGLAGVFPYVGAGVGYEQQVLGSGTAYTTGGSPLTLNLTNNEDGDIAAQGIVGVAFPIDAVPGLSLTTEYRYHVDPDGHNIRGRVPVPGGTLAGRIKIDGFQDHSALIGLRYAFGAAPPPAAAAAPAVLPPSAGPTRTYLVFFDWDRADLTGRARQIIADAAKASTAVQATRIVVSGNADRSGTPQYNLGLSQRRADNVAAELVRDGVARTAIEIHAYGDTRPLVPTAAGVREPQNRRVEIVLL